MTRAELHEFSTQKKDRKHFTFMAARSLPTIMTSKLEVSASSSEAIALAEVWNARQRSNGVFLIRELSVTNANVTKHFVAKVFRGKSWPNLERLYLQYNLLSDDGVEMLATCVAEGWIPALHTLNVASNCVGNIGAAALADLIIHKKNSLRNIYLYENKIGDLGAEALAQCCLSPLNGNPVRNLRELFIWGNNLSEAGKNMLCRARHDGLLLWIDLTAQSASEYHINEVKNGSVKMPHTRVLARGTSKKELSTRSSWQRKNMSDSCGIRTCQIGSTSLQREPVPTSHCWTPQRRTPHSPSQDFMKTRLSTGTIAKKAVGTTSGLGTSEPKQSANFVMVPNSPSSAKTRKWKSQGAGYTTGTTMKDNHRMYILLEKTPSSPQRQRPSASTIEDESFAFANLLMKAKAMDSSIRRPTPTLPLLDPHRPTPNRHNRRTQLSSVESPLIKSPPNSTFSRTKISPQTKEYNDKMMAKSLVQVSPTSPVGEYMETTLRLGSCQSFDFTTEFSDGTKNNSFQALLKNARLFEQQHSSTPRFGLAKDDASSLPKNSKNIQVPFFVPDLEGTDSMEYAGPGDDSPNTSSHPASVATENPQKRMKSPPTSEDDPVLLNLSFHQIRNHFEAKSRIVGKL